MLGRGRTSRASVLIAAALALALPTAAEAATFDYGFEDGSASGWTFSGDRTRPGGVAAINNGEGNPGRTIFVQDFLADGPNGFLHLHFPEAPAGTFAGNYGGALSLDLRLDEVPPSALPILVKLEGDGPSMLGVSAPVGVHTDWQRVTFPFAPGPWFACPPGCTSHGAVLSEAQIRHSLAGARFLDIDIDVVTGTGEEYRVDNIRVTEAPPIPPVVPALPGTTPVVTKKKKCRKKSKKRAAAAKKKRCKKKRKK